MMKPEIIDGLNSVNASYHSVKGLIKSFWEKDDSTFQWGISIPCNTIATVYIPATSESSVLEEEQKLSGNSVEFRKIKCWYAVF